MKAFQAVPLSPPSPDEQVQRSPSALTPVTAVGPYVQRLGLEQLVLDDASFLQWKNVTFYGFWLLADREKLQAQCDRYLNKPFELRPGSPDYHRVADEGRVLLYFADFSEWRAANVQGFHPKRRAGLWIHIMRGEDRRPRLFPLFEFTNCGMARTSGRELFGIPFELARIEMPGNDPRAGKFVLHTLMRDPECLGRMTEGVSLIQVIPNTDSAEQQVSPDALQLFQERRDEATYRLILTTLKQFPRSERVVEESWLKKLTMVLKDEEPAPKVSTCYQTLVDLPIDWALPSTISATQARYTLYLKDGLGSPIISDLGIKLPLGAEAMQVEGFRLNAPSATGCRKDSQERVLRCSRSRHEWQPIPYLQSTLMPPYDLGNASFHGFVLPADLSKLQRLLDDTFKVPTNGEVEYRAYLPAVIFYFAKIRRAVAGEETSHGTADVLRENEAGIWIPMVRVEKDEEGNDRATYSAIYAPYMCVDSPYADAAGREVFGIGKELATIDIPDDPRSGEFYLRPNVLKRIDRSARADREILASLVPIFGSRGNLPKHLFRTLSVGTGGLFNLVRSTDLTLGLLGDFLGQFLLGKPRFAALKQFPHAQDPTRASYQSVEEFPFLIDRVRSPRLLKRNYKLTINTYKSHPWTEQFGLETGVLEQLQGFSFDMDFGLNASRTIWKRSGVE